MIDGVEKDCGSLRGYMALCRVDWVVRIRGLQSNKSQLVGGCASDLLFWKVWSMEVTVGSERIRRMDREWR